MRYEEVAQTKLRNKFAVGKLGQAAKSLSSFMHNKCSLHKHTSLSPSTGKASYGSKMPVVSAVSVFAVTVKSQFCSCFLIEKRIFLYPKWRTAAGNGYEVWKITGSFFSPRLFPTMCCWQTSFRNLVQISVPCHSDVTNALYIGFIFCNFSKTTFFGTSS